VTAQPDARSRPLDARLRTSLAAVAFFGALLTLGTLATLGPKAAASVGVGAAIAVANLWALARIVAALLPDGTDRDRDDARASGAGAWALVALLKMFALFGVVWLLMRNAIVSPLPMLVGFGALPVGIAIGSIVSDRSAPPHP
jgi:hypothetical protein